MSLFDVLQAVGAIQDCKMSDLQKDGYSMSLCEALEGALVNCIDGRLTLTKDGKDVYRGMRESRSGG
jgi:hypothetical protein